MIINEGRTKLLKGYQRGTDIKIDLEHHGTDISTRNNEAQ